MLAWEKTVAAIYPDLAGKVVLVTGGASGIGSAVVRGFARQNSTVVFFDIKEEAGMGLSRELSGQGLAAYFQHVDLTDIAALRAGVADACKVHGPIAILINNAAHDERHPTEEVTPEYWDDRIAVNLRHQFFAAQAVLPGMKAAGQGVIVNFGSTSWMVGQGGMAAYSASKSGVIGLTRSLARDYGPCNIRVNAIAPGWIRTPMVQEEIDPRLLPLLLAQVPAGTMGEPEQIAALALHLCCDEAAYTTGQVVSPNGGLYT
jgi:NAD(P)-dependent dehydrogenase (short-subunit alcohol dehydrogenase family)